jgi:enoyl-CoA hydratase/carnithine racemase
MTERIIAKKEGAVGWLIFNNPERRNAVSVDMWEAIPSVLAKFESDQEVRVVVLAGAGDKAFVSGADISQFESQRSSQEAVQRYEEIAEAAQARLQTLDKPVLAMIRGYCLGAGVNIANVCDLRIAGDDARFGIPAAKMGLGYRASSMKNLVDTVGAPYAREIMITARQFTAQEAKDMGLVHHVVPAADLERFTREYCAQIAANAPLTMRAAKRIVREVMKKDYDAALCKTWVGECFESEDYAEGRKAFMEKRKAVFKGK